MPAYKVDIPGVGSFKVESDRELTDEEAYAEALSQSGNLAPRVEVTARRPVEYSPAAEAARAFVGEGAMMGFGEEAEAKIRSLMGQGSYEDIRNRLRAQQAAFREESPTLSTGLSLAGGLVTPGAAFALGRRGFSLGKEIATGAGLGGLQAYGQSTAEGVDVDELTKAAMLGAGVSGTLGLGTRLIAPRVQEGAQQLAREGVELTPGAAFGGEVQALEQRAESIPFVGASVRQARERGFSGFNRAAANRVLANIDPAVKVPKDADVKESIAFVDQKITETYNKAVPNLKFNANDPKFGRALLAVQNKNAQKIGKADEQALTDYVSVLRNRLAGVRSGEELQVIKSELSQEAFRLSRSDNLAEQKLGNALTDVKKALVNNIEIQNPKWGQFYRAADKAETDYRRYAAAVGADTGRTRMTPTQLSAAIRSQAPGGRVQFAEGRASPMQQFAEQGVEVLGQKVPESGTAGRAMAAGALLQGMPIDAQTAANLALFPLTYSETATKYAIPFLTRERPELIRRFGERARFAAPFAVPSLLDLME